jgi:DNA-binding Xre family transcriptional regulator
LGTIISKIEKLLEAKKLTKTAFAKSVGIHIDTVYNLNDDSIKVSTLLKISEVLGVSILDFLPNAGGKIEKFDKRQGAEHNHSLKLTQIAEESEVYGVTNYKERYLEALEKLNTVNEKLTLANERIMAFTDPKKDLIKKKKG